MERNTLRLARLYAQAVMDSYSFTPQDYGHVQEFIHHAATLERPLSLLSFLPMIETKKMELVQAILKKYHLNAPIYSRLIELLIKKKRLVILPLIFNEMVRLYKKKHGIVSFKVKSPHRLPQEYSASIERFLQHTTGRQVDITYALDPQLIAGLRIENEELLYENSIAKQLRAFAQLQTR